MDPNVLFVVLRLAAGCWLLWSVRRLAPVPSAAARPPVSIVVPARNEGLVLPTLLASLRDAVRDGDEVIVVDDHSSDDTAAVAAAAGAEVVSAPALPTGWMGKNWACHQGVLRARHDVVVFLDADVAVAPDALDRLVAELDDRGGLVSVQPWHETRRPYERLSALFNVVALMGTDSCTPLGPALAPSAAFGPVLACRRGDYDRSGGHAGVAGSILDDVALARAFERTGLPVSVFGGRELVRFRMYPVGLRQVVEGWSKNFVSGAGTTRLASLVLIVAWMSLLIDSAVRFPLAMADGSVVGLAGAAYLTVVGQLWWMFRRVGRFGLSAALAYPVLVAFFLAVFVRAGFAVLVLRRVTWKGRSLPARPGV